MAQKPIALGGMALGLAMFATPLMAQQTCPGEAPPIGDSCLVGHWIGQNTAASRMEEMLRGSVPAGTSRDVFPTMPALLGISVYADGLYVTMPLHQSLMWEDVKEDSSVLVSMDLAIGTTVGQIWTEGNALQFCTYPPDAFTLLIEGTSSDGGSASEVVTSGMGGPGFTPNMDYYCDAGNFNFQVSLPDPVGPISYDLTRVSAERLPEAFRDLDDSIEIEE